MSGKFSIDYDDDDLDLNGFFDFTNNIVERNKNALSKEITMNGEEIIGDIENRNKSKDKIKLARIKYILRNSNSYSKNVLMQIDYNDIRDIYLEIKRNKKSVHKKIFEFLFGNNVQSNV